MTPLNTTLTVSPVELYKIKQLPQADKEYLCFQINKISFHAAHCVKSRILNKAIDSILSVDAFEQQCVVIKCMLQSPRIEDNMNTIGIDQSLCNRSSFEHKCLNNIKKIYQRAGNCDDQQNLKDILYAAVVPTPEVVTYDSLNAPMESTPVKKPSASKSLCLFTNIFDVKKKTAKRRIGDAKSKRRAMKVVNSLWTKKTKIKGH